MRLQTLAALAAIAPSVFAVPKFTSPSAGGSAKGATFSAEWKDDGDSPKIKDLASYTIQLFLGGNQVGTDSQVIVGIGAGSAAFSAGNKASGPVPLTNGGPTKNGYYLQMTAIGTDGGNYVVYSDRFTLTDMTGVTPANELAAIKALSGTSGPANVDGMSQNNDPGNGADDAASGATGSFALAYGKQTGLTKYAPMQPIPPTKITKKNASPLNPTSSVQVATAFLPPPTVVTTLTESQTFSVSSMENTAKPQSNPGDSNGNNKAKYMARWVD